MEVRGRRGELVGRWRRGRGFSILAPLAIYIYIFFISTRFGGCATVAGYKADELAVEGPDALDEISDVKVSRRIQDGEYITVPLNNSLWYDPTRDYERDEHSSDGGHETSKRISRWSGLRFGLSRDLTKAFTAGWSRWKNRKMMDQNKVLRISKEAQTSIPLRKLDPPAKSHAATEISRLAGFVVFALTIIAILGVGWNQKNKRSRADNDFNILQTVVSSIEAQIEETKKSIAQTTHQIKNSDDTPDGSTLPNSPNWVHMPQETRVNVNESLELEHNAILDRTTRLRNIIDLGSASDEVSVDGNELSDNDIDEAVILIKEIHELDGVLEVTRHFVAGLQGSTGTSVDEAQDKISCLNAEIDVKAAWGEHLSKAIELASYNNNSLLEIQEEIGSLETGLDESTREQFDILSGSVNANLSIQQQVEQAQNALVNALTELDMVKMKRDRNWESQGRGAASPDYQAFVDLQEAFDIERSSEQKTIYGLKLALARLLMKIGHISNEKIPMEFVHVQPISDAQVQEIFAFCDAVDKVKINVSTLQQMHGNATKGDLNSASVSQSKGNILEAIVPLEHLAGVLKLMVTRQKKEQSA